MNRADTVPPRRDLVLVGGGHAHVLALRKIAMQRPADLRITLVSESDYAPYSGMLPGLVAGHYSFEEVHIDLRRYCARLGVRFVRAMASQVDTGAGRVLLEGRPPVSYDLLSLNIGSQPGASTVPGADRYAIPVKPVAGFYKHWLILEHSLARSGTAGSVIGVVGGGAGSVEMALAMAHRLRDQHVSLVLYCGGSLLEGYGRRAVQRVRAALSGYGVQVSEHDRVARVEVDYLRMESGDECAYDFLLWCTAAVAPKFTTNSGLPCDDNGFLLIDDDLRVQGMDNVFAVGDMAIQSNHPRPRAGVYAVRQGPVLGENLARLHRGQALKLHKPQSRFLSLLSLGDRRAVADRGLFQVSGAWVWRWKDRIDRSFMQRFVDLPKMEAVTASKEEAMHCGGCGAKLPAGMLRDTLTLLAQEYPSVVDPADFSDDAAVLDLPADVKLLQTTDSLRSLVNDPWLMGRIAALHALSDLHAMGARPHSCLAHITLPHASADLQHRDLQQLMSGAMLEMNRSACRLVGGHSLEGEELSVGFTVNGLAANKEILRKNQLRPGLHLVLTKPLGTATLFVAEVAGHASGREIAEAIDSMLVSNAAAADLAGANGASACTDVTGFGLLGHMLEMLDGNEGLAATLDLNAVPLLPGVKRALKAGYTSSLYPGNRAAVKSDIEYDAACDPAQLLALYDPQTSGGLLIAVEEESLESLLAGLQQAGLTDSACIGTIVERAGKGARVVISA